MASLEHTIATARAVLAEYNGRLWVDCNRELFAALIEAAETLRQTRTPYAGFDPIDDDVPDASARSTDPDTSKGAAASLNPDRISELEGQVLGALVKFGDGTIREVSDHLGVDPWSISPRFRPLVRKNRIRDTGRRRVGVSNRRAIVWAPVS